MPRTVSDQVTLGRPQVVVVEAMGAAGVVLGAISVLLVWPFVVVVVVGRRRHRRMRRRSCGLRIVCDACSYKKREVGESKYPAVLGDPHRSECAWPQWSFLF